MNNEEKNLQKTNINCEKTIYRKLLETIENTHFFMLRFFRIWWKNIFSKKQIANKNEIF